MSLRFVARFLIGYGAVCVVGHATWALYLVWAEHYWLSVIPVLGAVWSLCIVPWSDAWRDAR